MEDERVANVELTELAAETIQKIEAALQEKFAPILESKSDEDFDAIIIGMKKLRNC